MMQKNSLRKIWSGQHVVPVYEVTDCHSEAVPQNCMLLDNLRQKEDTV